VALAKRLLEAPPNERTRQEQITLDEANAIAITFGSTVQRFNGAANDGQAGINKVYNADQTCVLYIVLHCFVGDDCLTSFVNAIPSRVFRTLTQALHQPARREVRVDTSRR
jgi:hypothetical protein